VFSLKTANLFDEPGPAFLLGRRPATPSAGFGLEPPAPAVDVDKGGRDVLAARTGILLGGAIVALLGSGLTSFDGS